MELSLTQWRHLEINKDFSLKIEAHSLETAEEKRTRVYWLMVGWKCIATEIQLWKANAILKCIKQATVKAVFSGILGTVQTGHHCKGIDKTLFRILCAVLATFKKKKKRGALNYYEFKQGPLRWLMELRLSYAKVLKVWLVSLTKQRLQNAITVYKYICHVTIKEWENLKSF